MNNNFILEIRLSLRYAEFCATIERKLQHEKEVSAEILAAANNGLLRAYQLNS